MEETDTLAEDVQGAEEETADDSVDELAAIGGEASDGANKLSGSEGLSDPISALATKPVAHVPAKAPTADPVCTVGGTGYASLDEAIKAATTGDTIIVLKDCTTEGLNLSKDLTIQGADGTSPTITFTKYGIALWSKALTFKNCSVSMKGIGSTPYTAEWNWMTICAANNSSLTLDNVTMAMDGDGAGNKHAIYFTGNDKLDIVNGSSLTIKNYKQDALEWDGGDGGYNLNIKDSTFTADHNRSGIAGTFTATFDNSTVDVINSTGNGSNGSHYTEVAEMVRHEPAGQSESLA